MPQIYLQRAYSAVDRNACCVFDQRFRSFRFDMIVSGVSCKASLDLLIDLGGAQTLASASNTQCLSDSLAPTRWAMSGSVSVISSLRSLGNLGTSQHILNHDLWQIGLTASLVTRQVRSWSCHCRSQLP
jgi:hypothetical protein